jgi:hypothetical protein
MAEDLRTRACESCGWPALAGTRRCPFCREAMPIPPTVVVHAGRRTDTLPWLALAWIAAMLPVSVLVLITLGMPFALPAFLASFVPAVGVWLLHQRVSRRKRRISGRGSRFGTNSDAGATDLSAGSGNTSSDTRSR